MNSIQIEALTKRYGNLTAVDGLSLNVERGELLALLGVNGAGKTTVIRMLSTLTQPTGGDAFLNGRSLVHEPNAVKRMIAVSPQETAVAMGLSVRENLELICGVHGFSSAKCERRTEELLARMGLKEVQKRRAGRLSGGYQRRLSIAMALASEPEILFLDEPTLGLDVLARSELWDLIRSLKGKMTIVLTTHYMEEAEALSDRVAIMKSGRLLICDTAAQIRAKTGAAGFEEAFIRIVKGAKE